MPPALHVLACVTSLAWLAVTPEAAPAHTKEFWRAIVAKEFAVPDGASPYQLILELTSNLGSPDPELRDEFGYGIPAAWIYQQKILSPAELDSLRRKLMGNLAVGIGAAEDESVLLRSFSALDLSVLVALDNEKPYLEAAAYEELLGAALDYLAREKDVRGFVPGSGWHHSTAHTADLLKFLGRSRHLKPADQGRILTAIAAKLSSAGSVYAWGEDGRLARAVLSLLRRQDFDAAGFDTWVGALAADWEGVWKTQPFDPAKYVAAQNGKNLAQSLFVLLSSVDEFPARDAARDKLLAALRRMA
ncbi:MAG TPA: DUF2785 domain-containing protein [Candidatus Polarisedimenticolia bacterium]|nr:DUF2785 domain-containing protein [Candidatus Polarisedimenticolia bacterium]